MGSSSKDLNRLVKISKRRSLVTKSWYIVKNVASKWSFLDGPSMLVMSLMTEREGQCEVGEPCLDKDKAGEKRARC